MRKETYEINLHFTYNPTRKGAKYQLVGSNKFMNHGEFCECLAKSVLGFKAIKDANTRFDMGADISELNASVKSWNCGLTDMKLADNKNDFLAKFWEMSNPTTTYIWVYDHEEVVDLFYMDFDEFKIFVEKFGSWDNYCRKIRFKKSALKIVEWLDENC